jgi:hypothetical protein
MQAMAGTTTYKMNTLEQEILDSAGNRMAAEIDFQILANMLCQIGWRKIILKPMTIEDGIEVDYWTDKHIKGPFETMGLVWIFEQEQDANWFALRWL